jgi:hypothetical protein
MEFAEGGNITVLRTFTVGLGFLRLQMLRGSAAKLDAFKNLCKSASSA